MSEGRQIDVLNVSLGSTTGLRTADEGLRGSLRRAGARVEIAPAARPRRVRTLMGTDLTWALAARAARAPFLGAPVSAQPRAIVYSSTTAALLWRRPGAIRFDAPASGNRLGWDGLWQRPLERRRLREAPLLLPLSEGGLSEAPASAVAPERSLVLPLPVEASGPTDGARDIAAVTYAANPSKKGLDRVLKAWRSVRAQPGRHEGLELVVAGVTEVELRQAGLDLAREPGVRL